MNRASLFLALAILAGVLGTSLRLHSIDLPLLEYHSWRQCNSAGVARSFYRTSLNPFHPHIEWNGNETGPIATEFQLVTFLVAIGYRLFGLADKIARYVSCFFFLLSLPPLASIALWFGGRKAVPLTLLFFSLSPMGVALSRSIQPEQANLCFALWAICFFIHYLEKGQRRHALLAGLSLALAISVKMTALYLGFPFLALLLSYRSWEGLKSKDTWFIALLGLIPPLVWYLYAATFPVKLAYWVAVSQGHGKLAVWFSHEFTEALYRHCLFLLTQPLALLTIIGLLIATKTLEGHRRVLLFSWLFGVSALLAFAGKVVVIHNYYVYPLLPVCAIAASLFIGEITKKLENKSVIVIFLIALIVTCLHYSWFELRGRAYTLPERGKRFLDVAKMVRENTKKNELIVTSAWAARPEILYYADRRGWGIPFKDSTQANLAAYAKRGAKYYAYSVKLLPRAIAGLDDKRSLLSLVEEGRNYGRLNTCVGQGTGYYSILKLAPWLKENARSLTYSQWIHKRLLRTIHRAERVDEMAALLKLEAFALPYQRGRNEYGITWNLIKNRNWRLVHFDDSGMLFIKVGAIEPSILDGNSYFFINPLASPNFLQSDTITPGILAGAMAEAKAALEKSPESKRCHQIATAILDLSKGAK